MPLTSSSSSEQTHGFEESSSTPAAIPATLKLAAHPPHGEPRPNRQTLTEALLTQEQQAKQSGWTMAMDNVLGTWQLRFTAPKQSIHKAGPSAGKGFYVPGVVNATLKFWSDPERPTGLAIQNQLNVFGLKLRFVGPAKLLPNKTLLAFDFESLQVGLGNVTVLSIPVRAGRKDSPTFETMPIGKLPFFAFFAADDGYLAARGRGGGLALWSRVS